MKNFCSLLFAHRQATDKASKEKEYASKINELLDELLNNYEVYFGEYKEYHHVYGCGGKHSTHSYTCKVGQTDVKITGINDVREHIWMTTTFFDETTGMYSFDTLPNFYMSIHCQDIERKIFTLYKKIQLMHHNAFINYQREHFFRMLSLRGESLQGEHLETLKNIESQSIRNPISVCGSF